MTSKEKLTASFLNHFLTSVLIESYSLSAILANLASMSDSASNIVALVFIVLAEGHYCQLIFVNHTSYTSVPEIYFVTFNPAVSRSALASFLCRLTTTPAASQYSLSRLSSVSMDLQDLCMSARSAISHPLLAIEIQLRWYGRVQKHDRKRYKSTWCRNL